MRVKSVVLLLVTVWLLLLVALNWQVLSALTKINLVFTVVDTRLGALTAAVCLPPTLALIAYAVLSQRGLRAECSRQARELQAQRALADSAEASRVTELSTVIRGDLADWGQRLQTAMEALRGEFRDAEASIAATLGEMDDRIGRRET